MSNSGRTSLTATVSRVILLGLAAFAALPASGALFDAFPDRAAVASFHLQEREDDANTLRVCVQMRSDLIGPTEQPEDWPGKVTKQANASLATAGAPSSHYLRAELDVDWQPLRRAELYWFDGSFVRFADGRPKPVKETRRVARLGSREYVEVCQLIPFEMKHDETYFRQRFESVTPLGYVSWSAGVRLNLISRYDTVESSEHAGGDFVIPIIGIKHQPDGGFGDLPGLFHRLNLRRALSSVEDHQIGAFVDEYFNLPDIRRQVAQVAKKCGQTPTESIPDGEDLAEVLRACHR